MAPNRCYFLALPRELRDDIYDFYVADGGYVYDFESGKLKMATGEPVDLALILTCKQVADDMKEDSSSTARPETHGMGFIEYCVEDPKLHIERRASMWRNIFRQQDPFFEKPQRAAYTAWEAVVSSIRPPWRTKYDGLAADEVSWGVARWVVESLALRSAGMPANRFTLMLDHHGTPDTTSRVWVRIQRDAAWKTALEMAAKTLFQIQNAGKYCYKTRLYGYFYHDFPEAIIANLTEAEGDWDADGLRIKCNLGLGSTVLPESILQFQLPWDLKLWYQDWHTWTCDANAPPQPTWLDLLRENILPGTPEYDWLQHVTT
ncbi:hypothetical protein F5Y16DRAFT_415143 [Xylariaceae sp. FL0255]|nr:hypothetical protein F5Y16DRAFT_415143 [Xylariaceae sp. FL0255]